MNKIVLIRCDASAEIGFGHVVRCLALAEEIRTHHHWLVEFAMVQGPQGAKQVREQGFTIHQPPNHPETGLDEGQWLKELVAARGVSVLVLDVRSDLAPAAVQTIRDAGVLIVTIDDPSERRLVADLAFYPPVPQVERLDWTGFTGQRFVGWKWVLLRPEFARARAGLAAQKPSRETAESAPRILVTMGSSDPAGLTLMALEALETLALEADVQVVLGGGFMHEAALARWLTKSRRTYTLHRDVKDMAELMALADFAVASFGLTAYELAAMSVPAVYLCLTADHAESASPLQEQGLAISLGLHTEVGPGALAEAIFRLAEDHARREVMGQKARACVDGLGAERIANMIKQSVGSGNGRHQTVE